MKARHVLALGIAVLALAPIIGFLARHRPPPAPRPLAERAAPMPLPLRSPPDPGQPAGGREPVPEVEDPASRQIVATELRQRLGAGLSATARAQLAAGEVRAAAATLTAGGRAGATALYRLGLACRDAGHPGAAATRAQDDERALEAVRGETSLQALLEPMQTARARFAERFAAGCAQASLPLPTLRAGLREAASAGDAEALATLAGAAGSEAEAARMRQSAALLGSAQAQLELASPVLFAPHASEEARREALLWMNQAAHALPRAQSLAAACLRVGCAGSPADGDAARAGYEQAARRGDLTALAVLSGSDEWGVAGTGDTLAPLVPTDAPSLAVTPVERYAYAAFAARLAREGCLLETNDALPVTVLLAAERLGRDLRSAELEAAQEKAAALWAEAGESARAEQGCE
jgi:hypothetical protein